jgi:hypothetical protein
MSITSHTDIREVERYCHEASRRQLSATAMDKLQRGFDIKLPNPTEELSETDDNSLISLAHKGDWRSRQDQTRPRNASTRVARSAVAPYRDRSELSAK